ncbi:cysteine dioxygenase [Phlyctema vagabunda]|uniref:Cysteine dioxygenase n=1 Tax=Phlyctema vagabunda TaxID=108571 RepID=A0ABR4PP66_9HELO
MAISVLSHSAEQQFQYPKSFQTRPQPAELDPFHGLVRDIRNYLGTSNGIDSEDIDISYIRGLMNKYTSNPQDWARYAHADPSKNYTRNCVENINGKANILILVWNPQKGSPVHDHANAHCIMKILQGKLKEEIFPVPVPSTSCSSSTKDLSPTPLRAQKETIYSTNGVTYISDNIGLHRISNPDETELAVSLHLYTPPNAADFGYHIYDEKTGKSVFVNQAKANQHLSPTAATSSS